MSINTYKILCYLIPIVISSFLINSYINNNNLIYHWPGWSFLDLILYNKGFLDYDFHVLSNIESLRNISASFFSIFFPNEHHEIIIQFILFSVISHSLIFFSFALLIIFFIRLFEKKTPLITIVLSVSIVTYLIIVYKFHFQDLKFINQFLYPPSIADWKFLPTETFDPFGITLIINNLLLVYFFKSIKDSVFKINSFLIFSIILLFISSIFHPVNSLYIPLFLFFLIITKSFFTQMQNKVCIRFFFVSLGTIFFSFLCIKFLLLSDPHFAPGQIYEIYVNNRHPHHYKTSFYLDKLNVENFILNFIPFLILSIFLRRQIPVLIYIFTSITLFIFLINIAQFVFVEQLRIDFFTMIGLSRFNWVYKFAFILSLSFVLVFVISSIMNRINKYFSFLYINKNLITTNTFNFKFILNLFNILLIIILISFFIKNFNKYNDLINKQESIILTNQYSLWKETFKKHNLNDHILITGGNFKMLRELGLVNIYIDGAFSFDFKYAQEWDERNKLRNKFSNCIKQYKSISSCKSVLPNSHKYILVLDDSMEIYESPFIKYLYLNNNLVNLYKIN